jgi:Fe-S-cluster containining protein
MVSEVERDNQERLDELGLAPVECGTCQKCCHQDVLITSQELEERGYDHYRSNSRGQLYLERKEDGSCIYLCESGCSIYAQRPNMCRAFDCRLLAALVEANPVIEAMVQQEVLDEGKRRIELHRNPKTL